MFLPFSEILGTAASKQGLLWGCCCSSSRLSFLQVLRPCNRHFQCRAFRKAPACQLCHPFGKACLRSYGPNVVKAWINL